MGAHVMVCMDSSVRQQMSSNRGSVVGCKGDFDLACKKIYMTGNREGIALHQPQCGAVMTTVHGSKARLTALIAWLDTVSQP